VLGKNSEGPHNLLSPSTTFLLLHDSHTWSWHNSKRNEMFTLAAHNTLIGSQRDYPAAHNQN
jgi:hypothetical protein